MSDQDRTICSMPAFTEAEAKMLFVYHLQMASHLFELLPDGYKIPASSFDDFSLEAAQQFLLFMEVAYEAPEEKEDDAC